MCSLYRDLMLRTSSFSFVTATNGASVCACVRAILNTVLSSWTTPSNTSSGFQKHPRSTSSSGTAAAAAAAAVQHLHRTSRGLIYLGAPVFPLCNLRHPRDLKSTTSRRGTLYYVPILWLFTFARFFPALVGIFSRSRPRGTQGGRLYSTGQVWVPGGLRGACSGRSKSRNMAINHGVAFRGARAEQDYGKPTCQLFAPLLYKLSAL